MSIILRANYSKEPKSVNTLIYSHSFVRIESNQKPAVNCPPLLIG